MKSQPTFRSSGKMAENIEFFCRSSVEPCTGITFSSFRDLYDCLKYGFRSGHEQFVEETMTARSIRQTEQVNFNIGN